MKELLKLGFGAMFVLAMSGCRSSSKPFVRFDEIATSDHYPDHWIADTIHYGGGAEGDIAYLNALMKDHEYQQALYYCNTVLLMRTDQAFRRYVLFKRLKIEFLSHFISHFGVKSVDGYQTAQPRTSLSHSSLAISLNGFLASEGIDASGFPRDSSFASIGYPTEADVRYSLSLISATRNRAKSIAFADSEIMYQAEKDALLGFLDEFELEIVSLGVWKYAQTGSWDSAGAYCDYMSERYPTLKENLLSTKVTIANRPRLKQKSKAFAGVLSAVVPGAGQMYAGEFSDGLLFFLGLGVQAGCAAYLLNDVDPRHDRSEMVFGAVFSVTSIITYIANVKTAVSKTDEYNSELGKKEIDLFADSLKAPPPGYVR